MCEQDVPVTFFYTEKGNRLASYCKSCNTKRVNLHRKRVRDAAEDDIDDNEDVEFAVVEELSPEAIPDHLYLMHNPKIPNETKIGRSKDVNLRASCLSKSQNFTLIVDQIFTGQGFLETTVHRRLAKIRVRDGDGREWFRLDPMSASIIIHGIRCEASLGCM